MLDTYRVLDLTHSRGLLCAQILGDLGADVIQVEPPGGAPGRRLAPFLAGHEDPEHSLFWWSYARGKRSVELDIDADPGTFLRLVAHADFLIEAEPVGSLAERGFGYDVLSQHNPRLIQVTMTPYGSTGPKAHWAASDVTLYAAGGPMALTGDDDRPPLRVTVPQVWNHAAAEAAVGAMIALHDRHRTGLGQHLEVAAQQAMTFATQAASLTAAVNDTTITRTAGGQKTGDIKLRYIYPASDGYVAITHVFGAALGPPTGRLMEYVYDQGFCDEAMRDKDWVSYGLLLANGEEPISEFERAKQCVAECTATKTKAELMEVAQERRLLLAPISTVEDVLNSEQLTSRNYFTTADGNGRSADIRYPGAFAKFSRSPLKRTRRPPHIGEHTREVLEELEAMTAQEHGRGDSGNKAPLAGVKILDFMWVLAGPGATRILADWGSTVIRVESSSRLCAGRTIAPFMDGDSSPEKSAMFHSTNAGKRMLTLNLTFPEGIEVARDLVRWADVVTESFSPRAMKSFGLDYPGLCEIKPDIIMLSTCLMGQTGPMSQFAGYGNLAAAVSGYAGITGWPDRPPAGPYSAYTDYIAPRYNAIAVLAALEHKRRTGEGQHIDLSQVEASLHFMAPALLDYTVNGHVQGPMGNRDLNFAPNGVYPVAGDDQHLAIACETDAHWEALSTLLPGFDAGGGFASADERLKRQDELDAAIGAWTCGQDGRALEQALQEAGVPASMVQNSPELVADPQLAHLGHFVDLPHQEGGHTTIEAARIHMSRSQPVVDTSAPTFNRDMMFALQEVLGYDDERIGELLATGALDE